MRPGTEQRLDGCAETGKFKRFLDELNRVRPLTFQIQLGRNAGSNGEKTDVGIGDRNSFEKFNRVRTRRIEIGDEKRRATFSEPRLSLRERSDRKTGGEAAV